MSKDEIERRVPNLRFKGFTDDWMQEKILNLGEINPASNLPKFIEYVDLESVKGTSLISHQKLESITAPSRAQRLAQKGDIFFQTVRPYQKNNYYFDMDNSNFVFSTGYTQIRPTKVNGKFLFYKIQSDNFVIEVLKRSTGTSYPAINSNDLSNINFLVPKNNVEQKLIGNLLIKLDEIIALEQEKNRKLELIKKELTGTLYATSNSIPILRFNNFNKPWRKQPLSNALQIKNIRKPVNAEYPLMSFTSTDGITPKGQRYDRSFLVKNSNKKYKRTNYTDVIYSSNNLDVGAIGLNSYGKASISDVYEIFEVQKGYNPNFISTLIKEPSELNKILKYRQGALYGQYKIYPEDFLKIKSYFPSTEEQVIISTFLNKINVQISNNNKKIDKYLLIKKVLLKNLFI
ncbi:type I restriction enzyme, S subunit [Atopostipes suicloacalis DSM 15692]|uniref:Type I restriction enzyme, S subunit n=1 Tax=Atopostipes suicloacalis DSM 15692 TaxID=1121025 RepID=A0A1M4ZFH0_9LACT|nr:restriction endonuclease subunit S [Atopostipes suicloacalis]SHF16760.1 type I restriction enzyme, S subunit [Atopostipes suicloacalis DSM 15692]